MVTTSERWKAYQKVKASLSQEQQNVLSNIEGYMVRMKLWSTLSEVDISNDRVNDWRGGEYLEVENVRFLIQLGDIDIGGPNESTARTMFKMTRTYRRRDRLRFVIRLSDYFSKVLGEYIRDEKEA